MSRNPITMAEVVDRLFTRLSASYGAEWTRQWKDIPIVDMKTAWGHELAGFISDLPAIAGALDNLPERCPNVVQFKALCRANRTVKTTLLLPEPKSDPAFIAKVVAQMADAPPKIDGKEWARRKLAAHAAGDRVGVFGLNLARQALGVAA